MKNNEYIQLRDICVRTVIDLALMAAPALVAAPAAPTNFRILEESNKYVKVSFRDGSTNETTFTVWRRVWPNGEFSKVGQRYGNPSGTSRVHEILISDSGLPACFRASADSADGRAYSLTACTAATKVGWRRYNDTFFVVKPHDVPVSARYRYEDYIHKTWVYRTDAPHHPDSPTNPRTEMAWNSTYVAGYRMWEADVYISRGTDGSNIFQIFKVDHPRRCGVNRCHDQDVRGRWWHAEGHESHSWRLSHLHGDV